MVNTVFDREGNTLSYYKRLSPYKKTKRIFKTFDLFAVPITLRYKN